MIKISSCVDESIAEKNQYFLRILVFFKTKDHFLGMFHVDLNANIPFESAQTSIPTRDFQLSKRRFSLSVHSHCHCHQTFFLFSLLQRTTGTATIGLAFLNNGVTLTRTSSTNDGGTSSIEVTVQIAFGLRIFSLLLRMDSR